MKKKYSKNEVIKIIRESNIKEEEKVLIISQLNEDSILNEDFFKGLLKALGVKALMEIFDCIN